MPSDRFYSSSIPDIAAYEEIKELPNKPETLLIDVREPEEILNTGKIPTSINIPRIFLIVQSQTYIILFFYFSQSSSNKARS